MGVVGIAVGIVLLPELSRHLTSKDIIGAQNAFNKSAKFALNFTIPASVALIIIPTELVSTLFERGVFDENDTKYTALALTVYGIGLPAFVLQKVLQPVYFAREDTKTPFRYALIAMLINAIIAIGLVSKIGFISAAIATSVAGWSMLFLLWQGSRKFEDAIKFDDTTLKSLIIIVIASIIMGICVFAGKSYLITLLHDKQMKYLGLIILIFIGIITYFLTKITLEKSL